MEFFGDLSVPVTFVIAVVVALAILGAGGYLMRRFRPARTEPRLAVINAASVDGHRRLVLVRRDNVEHLLLIGGPTDAVIEPNIGRTGAATTAPAPVRAPRASPPPQPPPRQTSSPAMVREAAPREPTREAMTRDAMLRPPPVERAGASAPARRWTGVAAFLRTGGSCPAGAGTETHAGAAAAAASGPGRRIHSRRNGAAAPNRAAGSDRAGRANAVAARPRAPLRLSAGHAADISRPPDAAARGCCAASHLREPAPDLSVVSSVPAGGILRTLGGHIWDRAGELILPAD
jgi:flagellar protein FliO/FliZ